MKQRISEYLVITDSSGKALVQCEKCQYAFCPPTENYKNHALMGEYPPTKAGPDYPETDRFVLREFYCPGCATMLDVEMCLKDAPFVWDARIKLDG